MISMFRIFRKKRFSGKASARATADAASIGMGRLGEVIRHFPIGDKIRYHLESRRDIQLDSIVLAYAINDNLVYSRSAIHYGTEGGRSAILMRKGGKEYHLRQVRGFSLLVPDNRDDDAARLDYPSRAELGRGGLFTKGTNITLVSSGRERGLPCLDTTVRKSILLRRGYYANQEVVLLDALPESLRYIDQRKSRRFNTRIPAVISVCDQYPETLHMGQDSSAMIRLSKEFAPCSCFLLDFSDGYVRVGGDGREGSFGEELVDGQNVILSIILDEEQPKSLVLGGNVYRRHKETAVVVLEKMLKKDKIGGLGLIDILAIKTGLLEHPVTQGMLA